VPPRQNIDCPDQVGVLRKPASDAAAVAHAGMNLVIIRQYIEQQQTPD